MSRVLALTGSIGMGKSTTAQMFRDAGVPVHDADATVHALYAGKAAPLIEAAFPGTVIDGTVDRAELSKHVVGKPEAMARLEAIIHPLVREAEDAFRSANEAAPLVLVDVPLLYESGGSARADAVVVVSAPLLIQRERVLARPNMDKAKFEAILARQMPDAEKRARADHVIDTSLGMDAARAAVARIIEEESRHV